MICRCWWRANGSLWMRCGGGRMVYATCSNLDQENSAQVAAFLARHSDAKACPIEAAWGQSMRAGDLALGRQAFPEAQGHDGFFYAVLEKH
ncbi:MAG: hypothetical protein B7Y53_05825 [Halothiobacillus sp. 28-55-5]|nr:MAG: hypothetical protein B7Y53_05825 [Halothiobacillus sp. 28-55-5]